MARWLVLLAALGWGACAGTASPSGLADSGDTTLTFGDSARADADGAAPSDLFSGDVGPLQTRDFVVSDLLLPRNSAESKKYGFDFDNDGTIDNALGDLVSTLQSFTPQRDLADSLRLSVLKGSTLLLMRVFASNFTDHVGTVGRYYVGVDKTCCSDTSSIAACRPEALTKCFDGHTAFDVDTSQPVTELKGSISSGNITLGAKELPMYVQLSKSQNVKIKLAGAIVKGKLQPDGSITDGSIAGGLTQNEIDTVLMPELAQLVTDSINDPNTSASTRDTLINLFDANKDNTVTVAELKANSLVTQLIKGDVDVDGDGKRDLTLGVGFSATGAVIN